MKTDEELLLEFRDLVDLALAVHTFDAAFRKTIKAIQECENLHEAVLRGAEIKGDGTKARKQWFEKWLLEYKELILRIMKNEH